MVVKLVNERYWPRLIPAQNELIAGLSALNEKMKARIAALEKSGSLPAAGGVFESTTGSTNAAASSSSTSAQSSKESSKEIKVLKDELARSRDMAKTQSDKCELSIPCLMKQE